MDRSLLSGRGRSAARDCVIKCQVFPVPTLSFRFFGTCQYYTPRTKGGRRVTSCVQWRCVTSWWQTTFEYSSVMKAHFMHFHIRLKVGSCGLDETSAFFCGLESLTGSTF